ncbi:MAG: pyridoxamine 5'-phosphate oxidase family protein [Flavobacteriaceae bacterium]
MEDIFYQEIYQELQSGTAVKGHPFRFFSFASLGKDQTIGLRTVVLRQVSSSLQLTFYTDARSPKIEELQKNNSVSALFYHPSKMIQLRIEGNAIIEKDETVLKKHWETIPDGGEKDYNTAKPPGDSISASREVEYLNGAYHFCMVHIVPNSMDFLKLGKEKHSRIRFSLINKKWKQEFLVP